MGLTSGDYKSNVSGCSFASCMHYEHYKDYEIMIGCVVLPIVHYEHYDWLRGVASCTTSIIIGCVVLPRALRALWLVAWCCLVHALRALWFVAWCCLVHYEHYDWLRGVASCHTVLHAAVYLLSRRLIGQNDRRRRTAAWYSCNLGRLSGVPNH